MFLKKMDPDCTFSGLRRICDKSSGKAIWVTKESANRITEDNDAEAANGNVEEDRRLRAETHNVEEDDQLRKEVSRLTVKTEQQAGEMAGLEEEISRLTVENFSLLTRRLVKYRNSRKLRSSKTQTPNPTV
jgi:hypothetical protein